MYVCMYVCIYVCMYAYIIYNMYVCVCVCVCVCVFIYIYAIASLASHVAHAALRIYTCIYI
jgi:hypothetical protein